MEKVVDLILKRAEKRGIWKKGAPKGP